jgi:phage tail-like protein
MRKHGIVALSVLAALTLRPAQTLAAPPPVVPTTQARLSVNGRDMLVTYVGGLGSSNVVTEGAAGKTGVGTKSPGKLDFLTLTINRARLDDTLLQWRQDVIAGRSYKRNVTLDFLDADGRPQAGFDLSNAWPAQYAISALPAPVAGQKASSREGETVTFAYENLVRAR